MMSLAFGNALHCVICALVNNSEFLFLRLKLAVTSPAANLR